MLLIVKYRQSVKIFELRIMFTMRSALNKFVHRFSKVSIVCKIMTE